MNLSMIRNLYISLLGFIMFVVLGFMQVAYAKDDPFKQTTPSVIPTTSTNPSQTSSRSTCQQTMKAWVAGGLCTKETCAEWEESTSEQKVCNSNPWCYRRTSKKVQSCVSKLCIWHSDAYCTLVETDKYQADYNECFGKYSSDWYPAKWDDAFCTCIAEWWTELAVKIPFVSETRCIPKEESGSALPIFMWAIIKLLNTFILVIWFAMLVWAGVLYASQNPKKAKSIIIWVVVWFALYGSLWIILRLINPIMFQ